MVYEAYFDKDSEMITNNNYSIIIEADDMKKVLNYLLKRKEDGYYLRWITEFEDDPEDFVVVKL